MEEHLCLLAINVVGINEFESSFYSVVVTVFETRILF